MLYMMELWVELGWNYMKFHPNSTHNSTSHKPLIIKVVTALRWKGGITNDKKYFSEKVQKNILISVKKVQIQRFFVTFLGIQRLLPLVTAPRQ